ncbi:MAG TPA: magnesium/cobalt transporter CorA [Syntrophomonadaceae bacterium]|nr:magnesium/cobalt transporter CorA [Syntrophomonadaceae bacterium]HRX21310.1 magnesium/cobalt transporter CorA [Syntrophomonadaceae bacterium]
MKEKSSNPWLKQQKYYHPPGTEPGALTRHLPNCDTPNNITIMQYGPEFFKEEAVQSPKKLQADEQTNSITWINVEGVCAPEALTFLGEQYGLHPLSMEDVLNAGQRPKIERFDDYYFMVMYLLSEQDEPETRQVSIFWGEKFVITLEEEEEGAFDLLRDRLRNPKTKIREMGSDYLAYCIIDALVDRFFPRMDALREELDQLEDRIFSLQDNSIIEKIHHIKMKLLALGKLIWSIQELVDAIQSEEVELSTPNINLYLRDCYDHTVQISHTIDSYREICGGLIDTNLAMISSQQNEVMKVLTIIATIFIPLTFIVGVYGMNFNPQAGPLSMPELNSPYGYVVTWIFMILISLGMLYYFRRRKWF